MLGDHRLASASIRACNSFRRRHQPMIMSRRSMEGQGRRNTVSVKAVASQNSVEAACKRRLDQTRQDMATHQHFESVFGFQSPEFFSMPVFDSTKIALVDLLKNARDGKLQLPDFQRGWVWDDDGLRNLLASISQSFPVGAMMTLQSGGVRFKPRQIEGAPLVSADVPPDHFLLDGQQRITSLYQTTMRRDVVETVNAKKRKIKRFFYIDMVKALDITVDRLDAIIGIQESKVDTRNFGSEIVRDLSSEQQEYAQCMFPTNRIFESDAWQMGFFKYWGDDLKVKSDFWFRFQNEILAAFKTYQMPVIQMGRDTSRAAVCLVFEKVNTGGKKLDAFELITALYAGEEDGFMLREEWEKSAKRLSDSSAVREHPLTRLQATEFFQALALLHTLDIRKAHIADGADGDPPSVSCTRDTILGIPLAAYKRHAERLEKGFLKAGKFLFGQHIYGFKDVPYQSQIVPLAAILAELDERWDHATVRSKLAKWYWCGVFGEIYGSGIETRIAKDIVDVLAWVDGGSEATTVNDAAFRSERLDTMTSRVSAAYKGVLALLMQHGATDFMSGQTFDQTSYFDELVDIHHIFPKAWCEKSSPKIERARYDTIVNKTPLSLKTNRVVGGVAPSSYLTKLSDEGKVSQEAIDLHLKSHLIDPELLRANNFDRFIEARREALLILIERAMGKPAYRGNQTDEPEGEVVVDQSEALEMA